MYGSHLLFISEFKNNSRNFQYRLYQYVIYYVAETLKSSMF